MTEWNEKEVLRYLGYGGQKISEDLCRLLEECREELEEAASPRAFWREYPLSAKGDEIDLGVLKTRSRALARNLKDCDAAILFAATLGSGVDVLLNRYGHLQMSKCVVLQAAAAALLESFCDEKMKDLKSEYEAKGRYLRPRFSPGYGDFSLECQKPFCEALELNKRIGVMLTGSLLMTPSKSVTAVIGVSPVRTLCVPAGCEECEKKDCAYRRQTMGEKGEEYGSS